MLNGLDLFSGIGGLAIALSDIVTPVAYCERDRYAQSTLLSAMSEGRVPVAPIWDDVKTLGVGALSHGKPIDIICGGFPCQDISTAGNGIGLEGERSGLFFEVVRLIRELNPRFVFLENVPAIRTRGGQRVGKELASCGYDCRWDVFSAAELGANHRRERWWLLAHSHSHSLRQQQISIIGESSASVIGHDGSKESLADSTSKRCGETRSDRCEQSAEWSAGSGHEVADTQSQRRQGIGTGIGNEKKLSWAPFTCEVENSERDGLEKPWDRGLSRWQTGPATDASWWATEPNVGRVVNGLPNRAHRIKGLGNAVVPLQARTAFMRLMGLM